MKFWKRREAEAEAEAEADSRWEQFRGQFRECYNCHGLFNRNWLSQITTGGVSWLCKHCRPPYDSVVYGAGGKTRYYKRESEHNREVDKEGNPL